MINQDVIGDYLRGKIELSHARILIKHIANRLGWREEVTLRVLWVFYQSDSASYSPYFREGGLLDLYESGEEGLLLEEGHFVCKGLLEERRKNLFALLKNGSSEEVMAISKLDFFMGRFNSHKDWRKQEEEIFFNEILTLKSETVFLVTDEDNHTGHNILAGENNFSSLEDVLLEKKVEISTIFNSLFFILLKMEDFIPEDISNLDYDVSSDSVIVQKTTKKEDESVRNFLASLSLLLDEFLEGEELVWCRTIQRKIIAFLEGGSLDKQSYVDLIKSLQGVMSDVASSEVTNLLLQPMLFLYGSDHARSA